MPKDTASPGPSTPAKHDASQLALHRALGHDVIPLHRWDAVDAEGRERGKSPRDADWRNRDYGAFDPAAHMASGGNVGWRLRPTDLLIDVDPRSFAEDELGEPIDPRPRLEADAGLDLSRLPCVRTGGGGWHYPMTKPAGAALLVTHPDYPGVEIKTAGTQAVCAGSVHPCGASYEWDALSTADAPGAPQRLLKLFERPPPLRASGGGEHTPEVLASMLARLDPRKFASNEAWFALMAACHHATHGEGRQEFLDWSAGDGGYASRSRENARRWDSLHETGPGGAAFTVRTLHHIMREHGQGEHVPRPTAAGDFAREERAEAPEGSLPAPEPGKLTAISDQWVYVADAHMFVRRRDGKKYAPEQWRALHAQAYREGDIVQAVWKGKVPVRKREALVYEPFAEEFPEDGLAYNIWRPSGVEAREGDVAPFLDHVSYLFPDAEERDHLLDYLALLVRVPPPKIMFALLVHGQGGTGKSWLGQLMERIIGKPNTVKPGNDEVISRWTAWTEGAQLAVIEELMAIGRLEVTNRLKPIITEPTLRIEDKGCRIYSIPNHLNLMCFTNFEDALKIENIDRRWLVLSSPAVARGIDYYVPLFKYLEGGGGPAAVKHWLQRREPRLSPKEIAPRTRGKEQMHRLSKGDLRSHLASLLEEGGPPFDFDLVRFDDVVDAVPRGVRANDVRAKVTLFLKNDAGAVAHARYTKGDRKSYTLWSVRRHDEWEQAGAAARIDAFMEHLNRKLE